MNEEKSIYIILSQPGTMISKALKFFTGDEYNHSSIALDSSLTKMYSFGRRNLYNPFKGGFIQESIHTGIFARFEKTKALVLEIKVSSDVYYKVKSMIEYLAENKVKFRYNYLGVLLALFKKNHTPKYKFYCSQFVRSCLSLFHISNADKLPKVAKPIDFLKLENKEIIYKGMLKNYSCVRV